MKQSFKAKSAVLAEGDEEQDAVHFYAFGSARQGVEGGEEDAVILYGRAA